MTPACGILLSARTLGPACALFLASCWPLLPWLPAEGPRGALPAPHGPHVPRKTCSPPAQIHPRSGALPGGSCFVPQDTLRSQLCLTPSLL